MFTGIVETTGRITAITEEAGCWHIIFTPHQSWHDIQIGDSVSINGVCLTIIAQKNQSFHATIVPETWRVTNLQALKIDSEINLERALRADQRMGGHYVQGHVDATGEIIELVPDQGAALIARIRFPQALNKYLVKKGYIAIDGMSITLIEVNADNFTVTFIPQTQQSTIVKYYQVNTRVNLEVDILSKYIEKLVGVSSYVSHY